MSQSSDILSPTDAGLEPLLAADPRHDRGPCARDAVERLGEGGRSGGIPALLVGGLDEPARSRRAALHPDGPARLRVPEVVALQHFDRLPLAAVAFSRRNVAKRDHFTCQYCGSQPGVEDLTIDHVLPRAQGGTSSWTNCVAACAPCNARKADRTPEQAGMRLRKAAGPARVEAALRLARSRPGAPPRELGPVPRPRRRTHPGLMLRSQARAGGMSTHDRLACDSSTASATIWAFSPSRKLGTAGRRSTMAEMNSHMRS